MLNIYIFILCVYYRLIITSAFIGLKPLLKNNLISNKKALCFWKSDVFDEILATCALGQVGIFPAKQNGKNYQ